MTQGHKSKGIIWLPTLINCNRLHFNCNWLPDTVQSHVEQKISICNRLHAWVIDYSFWASHCNRLQHYVIDYKSSYSFRSFSLSHHFRKSSSLSLSLSSFSLYTTHILPTSLFNFCIISPPNSSIPLPNSFFPSPLQNPPIKTSNNHQEWKNPAAPTANAPKPPLEGNPLPPPPFSPLPNCRPMLPCVFLITSPT